MGAGGAPGITVPNGLIGYWTLDASTLDFTGNTAQDSSGNGQTGTLVGLTAGSKTNGQVAGALNFNGSSSEVTRAAFAMTSGAFSIAAWVKRNWSGNLYAPIFSMNYGGAGGIALFSSMGSNNQDWLAKDIACFGNGFNLGNAPRAIAAPGALTDGTWHHFIAVLGSTVAQIYLDGVALAMRVATPGAVTPLTGTAEIGGASAAGNWQDGTQDDVRVANRTWSASEAAAIYNAGLSGHR
jgi:hypothetical protein